MKKPIFFLLLFICLGAGHVAAQCPSLLNCPPAGAGIPPAEACDLTVNDPFLWNETYWFDALYGTHDLPDAPVELTLSATNLCTGTADVTIHYLLFLDLDGDGAMETVVDSKNLPSASTVRYNNAGTPNYGGGEPRTFDERLVPFNMKWQFALETTVSGANKTAAVRWNTLQSPGAYVAPELPHGTHQVRWRVEDPQGGFQICQYNFTVRDCKKPVVVCYNGLSVNIMPTQMVSLWAADFLQYAEDNVTPSDLIKIGIRKLGQGTGFPVDGAGNPITSITYTCDEQGLQQLEVWAQDLAGNVDFCAAYVLVQDNLNVCTAGSGLEFCAETPNGAGVEGVDFYLSGGSPGVPPFSLFGWDTTGMDGCSFLAENAIPLGSNSTVTPVKDDNPLNGVTTYDLVLISRHILATEPLNSPYKIIAADANRSGSVTTFDIVELRKLILGLYQELPNNTSWRFVLKNHVFSNPANPFQPPFPELATLSGLGGVTSITFIGMKVGDVNYSAVPNGFTSDDPDGNRPLEIRLPHRRLEAGETIDLPLRLSELGQWAALQASLRFDPDLVEIERVEPGGLAGMTGESFALPGSGLLNLAWHMPDAQAVAPEDALVTIRLRALQPTSLRSAVRLEPLKINPRAFNQEGRPRELELGFGGDPTGVGLEWPQPNPTEAGVSFRCRLSEAAPVTLDIMDPGGRILYRRQWSLDAGPHRLEVPAEAMPSEGLYLWRWQAGEVVHSGKLVRR
jgi:hypothetical protein